MDCAGFHGRHRRPVLVLRISRLGVRVPPRAPRAKTLPIGRVVLLPAREARSVQGALPLDLRTLPVVYCMPPRTTDDPVVRRLDECKELDRC